MVLAAGPAKLFACQVHIFYTRVHKKKKKKNLMWDA